MSSSITFNSLSLLSPKHSIPPSKLSRPFPFSFTPSNPISFQRLSTPPAPLPTLTITSSQTPTQSQSQTINIPPNLRRIVDLFRSIPDNKLKYRQLLDYASRPTFSPPPPALKTPDRRVPGCVSQVWLCAYPDPLDSSRVRFDDDSDSQLTKGFAALLVSTLTSTLTYV